MTSEKRKGRPLGHRITCEPPRDCFECPYKDCIRGGSSRALPTKEELEFTNIGRERPYAERSRKAPARPGFVDAGELTPKQREKLTASILREISRPKKEN